MELLVVLTLLVLGYAFGRHAETSHFRRLDEREKKVRHIPVVTGEWRQHLLPDDRGEAVYAGVVVAADYFKFFVSNLRNIFGGRMNAYETLLERGRREAILRVTEDAVKRGAYKIINLRLETSTISSSGGQRGALPCVELFAYGTALFKSER